MCSISWEKQIPPFFFQTAGVYGGKCRERCAASIGSVLANIENDIANI